LLERLRWPEGVMCPCCKDTRISRLKDYARYECVGCEYQFTVTSGTIFRDSHLPIWFLPVMLLSQAKKGMSAHQLKRTIWGLHKGSYKTAWYLCHRIRAAMKAVEAIPTRADWGLSLLAILDTTPYRWLRMKSQRAARRIFNLLPYSQSQ
jgi:transposase-like protein